MKRILRIVSLAVVIALTCAAAFLAHGAEYVPHSCERSGVSRGLLAGGLLSVGLNAAEDARCKEQMTAEQYQAWIAHKAVEAAERDAELEREMFGCDDC